MQGKQGAEDGPALTAPGRCRGFIDQSESAFRVGRFPVGILQREPEPLGAIPEQFLILVTCRDEKQQVELLGRFSKEGLECRVMNRQKKRSCPRPDERREERIGRPGLKEASKRSFLRCGVEGRIVLRDVADDTPGQLSQTNPPIHVNDPNGLFTSDELTRV
jgi:hypothetical protein